MNSTVANVVFVEKCVSLRRLLRRWKTSGRFPRFRSRKINRNVKFEEVLTAPVLFSLLISNIPHMPRSPTQIAFLVWASSKKDCILDLVGCRELQNGQGYKSYLSSKANVVSVKGNSKNRLDASRFACRRGATAMTTSNGHPSPGVFYP
jgi:hypothetical protein